MYPLWYMCLTLGTPALVCVTISNSSYPTAKNNNIAYQLSCIWEILNAGWRVFELSFKILLAETYLLMASKGT